VLSYSAAVEQDDEGNVIRLQVIREESGGWVVLAEARAARGKRPTLEQALDHASQIASADRHDQFLGTVERKRIRLQVDVPAGEEHLPGDELDAHPVGVPVGELVDGENPRLVDQPADDDDEHDSEDLAAHPVGVPISEL
jgi:hypothetical protein